MLGAVYAKPGFQSAQYIWIWSVKHDRINGGVHSCMLREAMGSRHRNTQQTVPREKVLPTLDLDVHAVDT